MINMVGQIYIWMVNRKNKTLKSYIQSYTGFNQCGHILKIKIRDENLLKMKNK